MDEKYRFEVYSYGHKVREIKSDDLEYIRQIAVDYLSSDCVGVKLFIDNEEVPYIKIKKTLNINTFSKL